jgi:hypothetical protein
MSEAQDITHLLQNCKELSAFCTQNGWIISESLYYEIIERHPESLFVDLCDFSRKYHGGLRLSVRSEILLWPFVVEIECPRGNCRSRTGLIFTGCAEIFSCCTS